MLNRRKAMIGWLVYTAGKPLAKRALKSRAKGAKRAVPGTAGSKGGGAPKGAMLAAAGAVLGGLLFWRNRRSADGAPDAESAEGAGSAGESSAGSGTGDGSEPAEN
jgi:hypothetical protein